MLNKQTVSTGNGWIKLYRRFLDWEWYSDHNTSRLFIHLLIKANHSDKKWRGILIPQGSVLTGRKSLSKEVGLSEQQVRSSLNKLKSTGEITIKATNKHSIIELRNWKPHQLANQLTTTPVTSNQPTDNQQVTTTKKDKNVEKGKNERKDDEHLIFNEFKRITRKQIKVFGSKASGQLSARLKDGFTAEEVVKAIESCSKDPYHIENPQFLTLEYITRQDILQKHLTAPAGPAKKPKFDRLKVCQFDKEEDFVF